MSLPVSEQQLPSQRELIPSPEEKENFGGQRVLVIGGPDAHGVSMAVTSAQYLESKGAGAKIYVGSPVIREGKGATHPGAFYSKTLPKLDIEGYDRVVVADIPLDFRQLEKSEAEVIKLTERLNADRQRRNLPPIEHSVFFLDHHETTKFQKDSPAIVVKWVPAAEACRLGAEPSKVARIGSICDRDVASLPITAEEMVLAKGLDAAVRPDPDVPRPTLSGDASDAAQHQYQTDLREWEDRAEKRLYEAIDRLKAEDWEYFNLEGERLSKVEIPTASGFGQIALVDTQDLTGKFAVLKLMEMAIENSGVDKTPYAIGVLRAVEDKKMGREPADVLTVIRHWTREDLPSVKDVIVRRFGKDFIDKYKMYGAANAQTVRLPVNDRKTAKIAAALVETFAGREMPDFSQVKSVVMCGDPNSGKSVYSAIFREALRTLGVRVAHLDLDKAAPTPSWYLEAEVAYKEAESLFSQGRLSRDELNNTRKTLEEAAGRRKAMKRPWSIELAEEAKQELLAASVSTDNDFVIGDIGGGKIEKDETGKIIKITRLTPENARILEGTDAVIIVSDNPAGAAKWKKLIEIGIDPETGVRINREKPLQIIGIYQSVLEGNVQRVAGTRGEAGVVTNLDRSKAERKYNPSVFASAMFVSEAVETRRLHEIAEQARNPHQEQLRGIADDYSSRLKEILPEGSIVDLGGSLRSNTALRGHNDIDLRILLPDEWNSEEKLREVSAAIADIVPFQKVRPVGTPPNDRFAVMHQIETEIEGIEGGIELELSVRPAEGYVGYGKFQKTLPQRLQDEYVVYKSQTVGSKEKYKKIKDQFYAMSRWLYANGYWDQDGNVTGTKEALEEAKRIFWGNNIEEITARPKPEI